MSETWIISSMASDSTPKIKSMIGKIKITVFITKELKGYMRAYTGNHDYNGVLIDIIKLNYIGGNRIIFIHM